jgi:hypothetical protein
MVSRGAGSVVLSAYLAEFERQAHVLGRDARIDLRSRIWRHCADRAVEVREAATPEAEDPGAETDREAALAAALAELGPPAALVRAELESSGARPNPFRPRDLAPLHLLGAAFLTLGVGAVVGMALLWSSRVWPLRHKIAATVLLAAGAAAVPLLAAPPLDGWPGLALGVIAIGPFLAAAHLWTARIFVRKGAAG